MWSGHSLFHLFSYQKIGQEFFNRDILDRFEKMLGTQPYRGSYMRKWKHRCEDKIMTF